MLKVVEAVGTNVEFVKCEAGAEWWEKDGGTSLVPDETWAILDEADACYKGPTTTPGGAGSQKKLEIQKGRIREVSPSLFQRTDLILPLS